jgi:16S rRNA (uracil1498-N3)-methyltransferase
MANPRLLIDAHLGPGVEIALEEGQARHVGTVLRLKPGDKLRVFNARDGEWAARIAAQSKRGVSVRIEDFLREAIPPFDLDLLFAPVKRHATDLIVEKATELGVARLRPVITQRTIADTVRVERLALIAREAAEQTERCDVPEVCAPVALAKIVDGWDVSRPLLYADESGDDEDTAWGGDVGRARPLLEALQNLSIGADTPTPGTAPRGGGEKLALLIGPEGGFTPEERRMLRGLSFVVPVSLGPRILRAETAVIAALAIIQASWGDWRG